jgi:hypothetical protein
MSETEESQSPEDASGGFLALLAQFDWLKIPGAVRAIAHLVTGVGDAGAAWIDVAQAKGQQIAQEIRDRTAARKSIMAATAKAAAARAARSPELVDRMIDRLVAEGLKRQENREAIAIEAGKLLDETLPDANTKGPSEDWLNVFSSYAEKATSEQLRQHWAQVLAGEIRAPGTFSLATLQLFSILDQAMATDIETASTWVADNEWIPVVGDLKQSPKFDVLIRLDAVGFLRRSSSRGIRVGPRHHLMLFQKHAIIMSSSVETVVTFPAALLTEQGKEALKIASREDDLDVIRQIANDLKSRGPDKVQIGEIVGIVTTHGTRQVELENEQDV